MGVDEKRGQKHPGTTPCSFPNEEGWQMGRGGKGRRGAGEEGGGGGPLGLTPSAGGPWPAPLSLGPAAEIPVLCTAQLACCQSCASSRPGSGKWGTRRAYGRAARKYRAKRLAQGCSGSEAEAGTALPPCHLHDMESAEHHYLQSSRIPTLGRLGAEKGRHPVRLAPLMHLGSS